MKFLEVISTSTRHLTRKSFTRKHVKRYANCLFLLPELGANDVDNNMVSFTATISFFSVLMPALMVFSD